MIKLIVKKKTLCWFNFDICMFHLLQYILKTWHFFRRKHILWKKKKMISFDWSLIIFMINYRFYFWLTDSLTAKKQHHSKIIFNQPFEKSEKVIFICVANWKYLFFISFRIEKSLPNESKTKIDSHYKWYYYFRM